VNCEISPGFVNELIGAGITKSISSYKLVIILQILPLTPIINITIYIYVCNFNYTTSPVSKFEYILNEKVIYWIPEVSFLFKSGAGLVFNKISLGLTRFYNTIL